MLPTKTMEIEVTKSSSSCTCTYCIDQFFDFDNKSNPCPNYKPPQIERATTIAHQTCPICLSYQYFLFPIKKCGHSFCLQCILTWKREKEKSKKKGYLPTLSRWTLNSTSSSRRLFPKQNISI